MFVPRPSGRFLAVAKAGRIKGTMAAKVIAAEAMICGASMVAIYDLLLYTAVW
ncbi:uncharacterized protein BDW70DRAFT_145129, partial [Aspergillus foveolatus]|uniref:uncharacterized protein n=1 Tax=Aspergillus foveolatus TaxID=210207 RepID=UPI003CCDD589